MPNLDSVPLTGAASVAVSGLTGATAASRYVGGTASGAPTSGTFVAGDFVIDQTGQVWVCITAGTPGTWIATGSGNRLGLATNTGSFSTASTTPVDVTGLTTTVTCDGVSGLSVVAFIPFITCTSAATETIQILDGATVLCFTSVTLATSATGQMICQAEVTPSAGSHTYKVQAKTSAGTVTYTTGATDPAFIRATRC